MAFRIDRVRLVILLKRKSTLSKEEFSQYWSGTHSDLFMSLEIVKSNLIKYEQAYTNQSVLLQLVEGMGLTMHEWDGMAIFEAESYAKIFEVFQNEEYKRIVVPDEHKFVDREASQIFPLDLFTVIDK
ncbi:hypothetical protein DFH09DRAFT_1149881 [Mycena vulgaris]|nr:hypothetical protein DFH09DRAFT_1149881 [Mycena vulgaris]